MPADEPGIVRLLDEQDGSVVQDVGADEVLDGVHEDRVVDDLVETHEIQMRVVARGADEGLGPPRFGCFQFASKAERIALGEHVDRRHEPVAMECADLLGGQRPSHDRLLPPFRHDGPPDGWAPRRVSRRSARAGTAPVRRAGRGTGRSVSDIRSRGRRRPRRVDHRVPRGTCVGPRTTRAKGCGDA